MLKVFSSRLADMQGPLSFFLSYVTLPPLGLSSFFATLFLYGFQLVHDPQHMYTICNLHYKLEHLGIAT